jgi:hypothetical protein
VKRVTLAALIGVAVSVTAFGCGPSYVDLASVPKVPGGTKALAEKYPHVVIDGKRLDFSPKRQSYVYAGTDVRALWMSIGGDDKTPPKLILSTPERRLPDGTVEWFDGHYWRKKPHDSQAKPLTAAELNLLSAN